VENIVEFERSSQEQVQADLGEMCRGAIRLVLEDFLEQEVERLIGAKRYERNSKRRGTRNGSYLRGLLTSMGHIEVKVPRTREGSGADVLGRYQRRSDELDEMITQSYVDGVSQRDVGNLVEKLTGRKVSKSAASRVAKRLEQTLEELRSAPLEQEFPYLYLDATFLDARWARGVENVSALVAYGVGEDGHRHLLGVHIGAQESEATWKELLTQLLDRGLRGVKLVIRDEHQGLKKAARLMLPEAQQQRCTVHLQRNVLDHVPKRLQKRVAREVGEIFKADHHAAAKKLLKAFTNRWQKELPEAVECLVNGFADASTFFEFPKPHWKRIRTTNGLERLHGEIKRRIRSVGAFPDRDSALRLVAAVAIQTAAIWGDRRYLDMSLFEEIQEAP
jgi:putative transposase